MKTKTSDLIGPALDWAVAKCEGYEYMQTRVMLGLDSPSTDWYHGGPIIEREKIGCWCDDRTGVWGANKQGIPYQQFGPTPLLAAMRCYVASKLGDEVEVPDDLT